MWRSNMLYFPICRYNHWFSFVVCLKERLFVFLDSFYDQFPDFHIDIRDMMHWTPGTPISNLFSSADIDNIRIKLANELCFSPFNSADKSFVTNFFGDSRTTQATFSLLGADQA
ncbi:hypothetical protein ACQJBY_057828 [Aegilops geniculata]